MHDGHEKGAGERREELARFLRTRRARLSPAQVGLPAAGRRRTPGLRREELAELAGVGVSWYTWLEQGRPITASVSVLDSLARALRLDGAERAHLYVLARHEQPAPAQTASASTPPAVCHILEVLAELPAYVANARWDVLSWNAAACRVFWNFADLDATDRNLLRLMFLQPHARQIYPDWPRAARQTLAHFRASAGRYMDEEWFSQLVAELSRESAEFAAWWDRADILGAPEGAKEIEHPVVGRLALELTLLQIAPTPDLWLMVYTPLAETETSARLTRLMSAASP